MLKEDYKTHVAANKFGLHTLPICGARTRSRGLCKHKGNIRKDAGVISSGDKVLHGLYA